jgi:hypothetical protein
MGKLSGGGITSNKLVKPGVKTASPTRDRVHVGKVSRIGVHEVLAHGHAGAPLLTSIAPTSNAMHGNAVAASTRPGPGGSRTVRPSGHQGMHTGKGEPSHPGPRPSQTSSDPLASYPGDKGRGR